MPAILTIVITDTCGCRRNFLADRASLDCGAGCLELQAGSPCYCRKFDDAVLRIFDAAGETALTLHNGMASLTATALHILCEAFRHEAGGDRSAGLKFFPAEWPETPENIPPKNDCEGKPREESPYAYPPLPQAGLNHPAIAQRPDSSEKFRVAGRHSPSITHLQSLTL